MNERLLCYILLSIGQILLDDKQLPQCDNYVGKVMIILHHFFCIYMIFGSIIFDNCKLHLLVLFTAYILNLIDGICPFTIWHNIICKKPRNATLPTYIDFVFDQDKQTLRIVYKILLMLIIGYDLKCVYNL
jgi:hypothetical protein